MPQKFLHLNCFFTCGMIASNLPTFCSIVLAVGGCTRAPRTSASLVRAMRSLIAFAWSQLLDLTISVYGPESDATDATPYQDRKSTRLNSSHGYISYAVFCLKKKKKTQTTPTQ